MSQDWADVLQTPAVRVLLFSGRKAQLAHILLCYIIYLLYLRSQET